MFYEINVSKMMMIMATMMKIMIMCTIDSTEIDAHGYVDVVLVVVVVGVVVVMYVVIVLLVVVVVNILKALLF